MVDPRGNERTRFHLGGVRLDQHDYLGRLLCEGSARWRSRRRARVGIMSRYLFKVEKADPDESSERLELRLPDCAALECADRLSSSAESEIRDVWLAPTNAGRRLAKNPPIEVRRLWGWEA